MTLSWEKSHSGWGTTEYRARSAHGGTYLAKKTGGRHIGWELTLVAAGQWRGERVSINSTLRSAKDIAELRERRLAAARP